MDHQVTAQQAGTSGDTTLKVILDPIAIRETRPTVTRLSPVKDLFIFQGKKSEIVQVTASDMNVTEKVGRQLFAKVPGVFVYDMDGTGNQINISTRGLDPHRGWEFNIRKDGILTNTDMYGYPASHFTLPMEAVERIEIVRGTGALQYGAQFGGMLNYVTKQPDTVHVIGFETVNTAGSYGLLSTYNAVSGKVGKLEYAGYYSRRVSKGYRDAGKSDFEGYAGSMTYRFSKDFAIHAELSKSRYLYQIPGPLTDAMFESNPQHATRERNYYSPDIYVPALIAEWQVSPRTRLKWTHSGVFGQRSSVTFDRNATIPDTIIASTLEYANRKVDIDNYHTYNSELRLMHTYQLKGIQAVLTAGVSIFYNRMHRRQQGVGTTGTDYDLTLTQPGWGRDMWFDSRNVAYFAENLFQVSDKFSVSPGVRVEQGHSDLTGKITYLPDEDVPNTIDHRFPLFGVSMNYAFSEAHALYAGASMAYRPVILKDIVPATEYERVDDDLEDATGYIMELGYRGTAGRLTWDVSAYRMQYNNRLGTLVETDSLESVLFRTNIGNSLTHGVEVFGEYTVWLTPKLMANLFTSTAYTHARYKDASVPVGSSNVSVDGNHVESTPAWISRNGFTLKWYPVSLTFLYSYTALSYADPLNTELPSVNGAVGLVPAYGLLDINGTIRLDHRMIVRFSLNNVTNKSYFTKRPTFYPGPGVWPSDGRTFNISFGVKL